MKDFCKWLGVSDKIAKLIVWLFIGMAFLIVTNVMLESIGLPYYKITVDNLSRVNYSKILDYILSWIMCLISFYSAIFLVFRVKEFKKIFPYSILYLLLNVFITVTTNQVIANIYIPLFIVLFSYFYSNRKIKYIFYGIGSYAINIFLQFISYLYKIRFIDYTEINIFNRILISIDFFIVMFIIIFIKEIVVKKKKGE